MGKIERIQVAPEDRERLVKLVKDPQHAAEDCVAVMRRARSGATKRSRSERILFLTQHIGLIRTKVNQRPIQQLGES
jgi:Ribonuclease G/E